MLISLIIPVFNDPERLELCLKSLVDQSVKNHQFEIIVVDNNSTMDISEVTQRFSKVNLVHENTPGSYAARNKGILTAKGEIIAFTDSDCVPQPNWLEQGVQQLLTLKNGGFVGGKVEFFFQEPNQPSLIELFDSVTFLQQEQYIKNFGWSTTSNMFTFKHVLDEVGLFNHKLKSGGDAEWGKRVVSKGYSFGYAEKSIVLHPARHSWPQVYKKLKRVAGGAVEQEKINEKLNQKQNLLILQQLVLELKPPLRLAFIKVWHSQTMNSYQKVRVYCFSILVHYVKIFERFRVLAGGTAAR